MEDPVSEFAALLKIRFRGKGELILKLAREGCSKKRILKHILRIINVKSDEDDH